MDAQTEQIQRAFLWGLKITDSMTMELTARMTTIALGVATICFICNMAYNYLHHGVSQLVTPDENKFPDMMEVARCLTLFFCLSLYTPITQTIVGTLEVINEATSLTGNRMQEFAGYVARSVGEQSEMIIHFEENSLKASTKTEEDKDKKEAMEKEAENKKQGDQPSSEASGIERLLQILNPGNAVALALHAIATLLVGIIQVIIIGIAVVVVKVLIILGPFVFAFSMLPVFSKQLTKWFGTLCSVGMVFTVINVLNQIMLFSFQAIYTGAYNNMDEATKQFQILAQDLAMIGSYCSCFWLAGLIVGHGDAGRIISKTMAVLTTAATMTIAGKTVAGGAAGAGRKSIIDD